MKRSTALLVVLLMPLLIGGGSVGEAAQTETLTLTIPAGEYQISKTEDGYGAIEMEGFGALGVSGQPQLPARTFLIALPPSARVQGVHIAGDGPVPIPGTYRGVFVFGDVVD
jgi:hypothetical protein